MPVRCVAARRQLQARPLMVGPTVAQSPSPIPSSCRQWLRISAKQTIWVEFNPRCHQDAIPRYWNMANALPYTGRNQTTN